MTVDIEHATKALQEVNKRILEGAEIGVARAMLQLGADAVMQKPTVPLKEGFLRGSMSIFVQNEKIQNPSVAGDKNEHELNQHSIAIKNTHIVGVIGFNVPYAARLHESPDSTNFSEESAGPKYLETKMANNKSTYKKIISNAISEQRSK